MSEPRRAERATLAIALVVVAIWGGSPAATKLALAELAPLDVALARTLLAGCLVAPLLLAARPALPREPRQRRLLALSAASGFIGFPVLFSLGQIRTSTTHATLILAFLPVLTALWVHLWDRTRPTPALVVGSAIALVGEAVLALGRAPGPAEEAPGLLGDLLVLASGASSSFGYVAGARLAATGYPSRDATFWGVALASLVLLPFAPGLLDRILASPPGPRAWAGVLYLGAGASVLAYMLWYAALARGGITRTGLTQFLQPLVGLLLAVWLLGEPIGPSIAAATVLILFGTAVARRGVPGGRSVDR